MGKWYKKDVECVKSLSTKQKLLGIFFIAVGVIAILYQFNWSGFGEDSNKSVTVKEVINPKDGTRTTLTETTEHFQSGKTFWDWLGLAGTLAIPFVLFQFERREQGRADKKAEAEKAIADNNLREEALEAYIDRMSELLLDKDLKGLAPDDPLLDPVLDLARVRTLSVLRRLNKDSERKGDVIRFLVDAELVSELDMSAANLELADLSNTNLKRANLKEANLSNANLERAYLKEANLKEADLSNANLERANLFNIDLYRVKLNCANLSNANLYNVKLNCANLSNANLSNANLEGANLKKAQNITPAQIKSAKNWEKAIYDTDFRAKLGLPPDAAK